MTNFLQPDEECCSYCTSDGRCDWWQYMDDTCEIYQESDGATTTWQTTPDSYRGADRQSCSALGAGWNRDGDHLRSFWANAGSDAENDAICCDACSKEPDCDFWRHENENCNLYSLNDNSWNWWVDSNQRVGFLQNTSNTVCSPNRIGYNIDGKEVGRIVLSSTTTFQKDAECCNACHANSLCDIWVWFANSEECVLRLGDRVTDDWHNNWEARGRMIRETSSIDCASITSQECCCDTLTHEVCNLACLTLEQTVSCDSATCPMPASSGCGAEFVNMHTGGNHLTEIQVTGNEAQKDEACCQGCNDNLFCEFWERESYGDVTNSTDRCILRSGWSDVMKDSSFWQSDMRRIGFRTSTVNLIGEVANIGVECWSKCGGSGACDFCGTQGHCCQAGDNMNGCGNHGCTDQYCCVDTRTCSGKTVDFVMKTHCCAHEMVWTLGDLCSGGYADPKYGDNYGDGQVYHENEQYFGSCCLEEGQTYDLVCASRNGNGWHGGYLEMLGNKFCQGYNSGSKKTETFTIQPPCSDTHDKQISIVLETGDKFADEISWTLGSCSGSGYDNDAKYGSTCCLSPGTHTLSCKDSFGDGWNGGRISLLGRTFCEDHTFSLSEHNEDIIILDPNGAHDYHTYLGCAWLDLTYWSPKNDIASTVPGVTACRNKCRGNHGGDSSSVDFDYFGLTCPNMNQVQCYCSGSEPTMWYDDYMCNSWNGGSCTGPFTATNGELTYNLGAHDSVAVYSTAEASASCSNFEIRVQVNDYGYEITWTLDGQCSGGPYDMNHMTYFSTCCLEDGVHTLTCMDSAYDGWHGGHININDQTYCHDFWNGDVYVENFLTQISGGAQFSSVNEPDCSYHWESWDGFASLHDYEEFKSGVCQCQEPYYEQHWNQFDYAVNANAHSLLTSPNGYRNGESDSFMIIGSDFTDYNSFKFVTTSDCGSVDDPVYGSFPGAYGRRAEDYRRSHVNTLTGGQCTDDFQTLMTLVQNWNPYYDYTQLTSCSKLLWAMRHWMGMWSHTWIDDKEYSGICGFNFADWGMGTGTPNDYCCQTCSGGVAGDHWEFNVHTNFHPSAEVDAKLCIASRPGEAWVDTGLTLHIDYDASRASHYVLWNVQQNGKHIVENNDARINVDRSSADWNDGVIHFNITMPTDRPGSHNWDGNEFNVEFKVYPDWRHIDHCRIDMTPDHFNQWNDWGQDWSELSQQSFHLRISPGNNMKPELTQTVWVFARVRSGSWSGWNEAYQLLGDFTYYDNDPYVIEASLRKQGGTWSDHVQGSLFENEFLAFQAYGMRTLAENIQVEYGDISDRTTYLGTSTQIQSESTITFNTADGIDGPYYFRLKVKSWINPNYHEYFYPNFTFEYPQQDLTLPIITSAIGEGCDVSAATNCPTTGQYMGQAAKLTIQGTQFWTYTGLSQGGNPCDTQAHYDELAASQAAANSTDIYDPCNPVIEVKIDGTTCENLEWTVAGLSANPQYVTCEYGEGTGRDLGLQVIAQGTTGFKYSYVKTLFSYAIPVMTAITGCTSSPDNAALKTVNCDRFGGTQLTVTGTNFGRSAVRIFVGGKTCENLYHDFDSPHELIFCTTQNGTKTSESILFLQDGGAISDSRGTVSYTQCPVGKYQGCPAGYDCVNGGAEYLECVNCAKGTYASTENAHSCSQCAMGTHAPGTGSSACLNCPVGKYSDVPGASTCSDCTPGTYAGTAGSTSCASCEAGKYSKVKSSTTCVECSPGFFAPEQGSDSCQKCSFAEFTSVGGSTSCSRCPADQVNQMRGSVMCKKCSEFSKSSQNAQNFAYRGCMDTEDLDMSNFTPVGLHLDTDTCVETCLANLFRYAAEKKISEMEYTQFSNGTIDPRFDTDRLRVGSVENNMTCYCMQENVCPEFPVKSINEEGEPEWYSCARGNSGCGDDDTKVAIYAKEADCYCKPGYYAHTRLNYTWVNQIVTDTGSSIAEALRYEDYNQVRSHLHSGTFSWVYTSESNDFEEGNSFNGNLESYLRDLDLGNQEHYMDGGWWIDGQFVYQEIAWANGMHESFSPPPGASSFIKPNRPEYNILLKYDWDSNVVGLSEMRVSKLPWQDLGTITSKSSYNFRTCIHFDISEYDATTTPGSTNAPSSSPTTTAAAIFAGEYFIVDANVEEWFTETTGTNAFSGGGGSGGQEMGNEASYSTVFNIQMCEDYCWMRKMPAFAIVNQNDDHYCACLTLEAERSCPEYPENCGQSTPGVCAYDGTKVMPLESGMAAMYVSNYLDFDMPLCRTAQEGMNTDPFPLWAGENLWPLNGYMPWINVSPGEEHMEKCLFDKACVGAKQTEAGEWLGPDVVWGHCEDGYRGTLCSECEKDPVITNSDYGFGSKAGFRCAICPSPEQQFLIFISVIVGCGLAYGLFIKKTIQGMRKELELRDEGRLNLNTDEAAADFSIIGKIIVSYLQFNSLAAKFDYNYPDFIRNILKAQEVPATITKTAFNIDCFVDQAQDESNPTIFVQSVLFMVAPLMCAVICSVSFLPYLCAKKPEHDYPFDSPRNVRFTNLGELSKRTFPKDSYAYKYVRSWNTFITSCCMTMFVVYPSIVEQAFSLFPCKQIGPTADDEYMRFDMAVSCNSGEYTFALAGLAFPMVFGWVLGIPAFVFWRLWSNRDELLKKPNDVAAGVLEKWHFLTKGYEPKYFYWEIIVMLRKVGMIVISVWITDFKTQSLMAVLLAVFALATHAYACPFISDSIDLLEWTSLGGSFATYFFGQFLFEEMEPIIGETNVLLVNLLIASVNVLVPSILTIALVRSLFAAAGQTAKGKMFGSKKNIQIEMTVSRKDVPNLDLEKDAWFFTGVTRELSKKELIEVTAFSGCRNVEYEEDGFCMASGDPDFRWQARAEVMARLDMSCKMLEVHVNEAEMHILTEETTLLNQLEREMQLKVYPMNSVLVVEGEDHQLADDAVRKICGFLANIRHQYGGSNLHLVKDQVMSLRSKDLILVILGLDIYVQSPNVSVVNETLQKVQNILSDVREDYMDDLADIVYRAPTLNKLRRQLKVEWLCESNTIYGHGKTKESLDRFWNAIDETQEKISRIQVGKRAPQILLSDNKGRIERKFSCLLGIGAQGDNVLVLPSNPDHLAEIENEIHLCCQSTETYTIEKQPFGLALSECDGTGNGVKVKVVGEEAARVGVRSDSFLLEINNQSVLGLDLKACAKKLKESHVPLVITTGHRPNASDCTVLRFPMYNVVQQLLKVRTEDYPDVDVVPAFHQEEKCSLVLGGHREQVMDCVQSLSDLTADIEVLDISSIKSILMNSDCRVFQRLLQECSLESNNLKKLVQDQKTEGLFNGKSQTCHIAVKGTIVQREKFKGFLNNIKLNLLSVASEVPIPREVLIALRKDCCAMVIPSEDDPCVVILHDAMFHPGHQIRTEEFVLVIKHKCKPFMEFMGAHRVVFGSAQNHSKYIVGQGDVSPEELDVESSKS